MNKKLIRRGMEYYVEMEALAGEDYEYQMLMANSVDGLLSVRTEQINQKKMVLYNVTGYHSWEDDLDKIDKIKREKKIRPKLIARAMLGKKK